MDIQRRKLLTGDFTRARHAMRLPWLTQPEVFTDLCTRCGKCLDVCPENIILGDPDGFPFLSFEQTGCTFCGECAHACPEPIFEKELTQPAWDQKAQISNSCLALNQVACQSCQDACETRAIHFQFKLGSPPIPLLELDNCTGCGACLSVCPSNALMLIANEQELKDVSA